MPDHCPGLDSQYWKPEDIFDVLCPACGAEIEFCKDEPVRICSECQKEVRNPKLNLACAKWCANGAGCLGILKDSMDPPPKNSPASSKE